MVNIYHFFGWDITTSGLEKQTSTILEFYFRFRFRPFSRNLHFILHQLAEFRPNRSSHCGNIMSYRFIKMAASDAEYYFRFRICWYHCLQKDKVYQQTKFRPHISIDGWDLTTSVFEKQTSAILEFYFRLWSLPLPVICMSFCITLPNFVQIGAPTAEIWCHFYFSRWRPRPLNTSSGFVFVYVSIFRRSIDGWDLTTAVFEKQTFAILEIYFRFWFRPFARNLHTIQHQATEFRPNRSTHCGNMTSYPFLKMVAATAKYYFRFRICWRHCLQKVKVYQQTKFRRYLNGRLRYNYFRFRNTNFRHIGILLPVLISTISP